MSASRPRDATRTLRIFVSHSHLDEAFALRLADAFQRAGAYVWIDKHDIKQGDFLKRINEGLAACDWLVLVETTDSLTSPAVEMEVNAALIRVLYQQMRGVLRFIAGSREPRIVPALWAPLQYYDGTADFARATADTLDAIRDGDARWAATAPAPTTPSLTPGATPAGHSSPLAALVADAYADNDWHAVSDASDVLLSDDPTAVTVAIWRMRGRALLELPQPARAVVALKAAYDLDLYDLPTVRLYARACLAVGATSEAEPLLKRALALSKDPATKLDVLREYVPTLRALDQWDDARSRIDQALLLRPDDPGWQRQRLEALTKLGRTADALALAQQIAARPDATAADWLTYAQAIHAARPNPPDASDADVRAQITRALDTAERAPAPDDHSLAVLIDRARRDLLPATRRPRGVSSIFSNDLDVDLSLRDELTARLVGLGFVGRTLNGVEVITPPLCDIPAGPFLMGSDKRRDNQAQDDELPQHTVTLAAYQIARYPVTVAEYACAVRAGAVRQPSPPNNIVDAIEWRVMQEWDQPTIRVSWNDAIAYSRWLAKLTGQPWRLLTEAEWEKAARGTDGRIYPWGDAWDKTRANTSDGGPGRTTPVGTYPSGASTYGAQDMAGNVWEWCSSLYKEKYPYNPAISEDLGDRKNVLFLRGGSWSSSPRYARAAYRVGGTPGDSYVGGGFRVCLGSRGWHITGHLF